MFKMHAACEQVHKLLLILNIMPPGYSIMQSSITNEVSKPRHLHHVIRHMGSEKTFIAT